MLGNKGALSLLCSLAIGAAAQANTLRVPQDFPTIQAAIDAAVAGDTILVSPGTYVENITFAGKAVHVLSSQGASVTTIGSLASGVSVVTFAQGETRAAILEGFTITGADTTMGGGIFCAQSSPTIRANQIRQNQVDGQGAGIACVGGSSPLIAGNEIADNTAVPQGGVGVGIYCASSSPTITSNWIHDNVGFADHSLAAGGGIACLDSTGTIAGNVIERNVVFDPGFGGGIYCSDSAMQIVDNTIVGNEAHADSFTGVGGVGGGIYCHGTPPIVNNNVIAQNRAVGNVAFAGGMGGGIFCDGCNATIKNDTFTANVASVSPSQGGGIWCVGSTPLITNAILWNNVADNGAQIFDASATVTYSDVTGGWPGTGNIDADPQFTDPPGGDFTLAPTSPCVDAGDPGDKECGQSSAGDPRRLDGDLSGTAVIDMGALEFDHVHLSITGSFIPGGTLTVVTSGTAGLHVALFVGTVADEICVNPFGPVFFSFAAPWLKLDWGDIPNTRQATIPSWVIPPVTLFVQQFAFDPVIGWGNTSNMVVLEIE